MVADKWVPYKLYKVGDNVIFGNRLYKCNKPNDNVLPIPILGNTGLGYIYSERELELLKELCSLLSERGRVEITLNTTDTWEII